MIDFTPILIINKNFLQSEQKVGMMLQKKEQIQEEYIGYNIIIDEEIYNYNHIHYIATPIDSTHTHFLLATPIHSKLLSIL